MRRRFSSAALPVHRHSLSQVALDAGLVALAYYLAYRLRFDGAGGVPELYHDLFVRTLGFVVIGNVAIFALFGLYRHWMRYSSQSEYLRIAQACLAAVLALVAYIAIVQPKLLFAPPRGFVSVNAPTGVLALYGLLMLVFLGGVRFIVHAIYERPLRGSRMRKDARSVLIVGAGDGGRLLLREIMRNPELGYRPVGFIDDDPRKQHARMDRGLEVLGSTDELGRVLDDVEPRRGADRDPLGAGHDARQGGRRVPRARRAGADDADGVRAAADRRPPHAPGARGQGRGRAGPRAGADGGRARRRVPDASRVVLVTGAGGSIGSELCRQIARVRPERLVLLDHAEDNLFEIERELIEDRHALNTVSVLADCKEEERMREVFAEHQPTVVFHAAAYKHVGLMESNPIEAVRNNSLATRVMCRDRRRGGRARRSCSSRPTRPWRPATVMGASKALAEWAVEAADARYPATRFASVRFGNVLGSSGSVVPIFRRQIAAGGPVTVTDPSMTRYFMTIPEAVQLVIRAGSLANGGEVFVLEMGEPVGILDLAKDMIRLSGLRPGRDIAIEIVGPRPGEKLHEELFNPYEHPQQTPAQRILRADRPRIDPAWVEETFDRIGVLTLEGDPAGLAAVVAQLASLRLEPEEAVVLTTSPAAEEADGATA